MSKNADKAIGNPREDTIATVINLMRYLPQCSRAELSKVSGLVRSTITNIIDMLIKSNLVLETGYISQNCGRRSIKITLNSDKLVVLGIAVTRKDYAFSIIDVFGKVRAKEKYSFYEKFERANIEELFKNILDMAERFIKKNAMQPIGVGLALPGPYLINEKKIMFLTQFGWERYSFIKMFEDRLQIPVYMERDTNAGVMGEWWFENRHEKDGTKMFISTGDGVGVGIIVDGKIYHGESGTPGELGHMSINFKGPKCKCGNRGCLEGYCTEDEIKRQISRLMANKDTNVFYQPIHDFDDIISAYHHGNPVVCHVVNNVGEILGVGLANLIYLYDPGIIIIGGRLSKFGNSFLEAIKNSVKSHTYPFFHDKVDFKLSSTENDPVLMGAAAIAFDELLKNPLALINQKSNLY